MYGGLFGDLPSTKKAQSGSGDNGKEPDKCTGGGASNVNSTLTLEQAETPDNNKKRSASLVDKLGTAGTTMAFVPAALRNRKRPAASFSAKPTTTTKAATASVKEASVSHIHQTNDSSLNNNNNNTGESVQADDEIELENDNNDDDDDDPMLELHASVVDIYDPHVPNDLLAFWHGKAMERERLELERQAKETLQRQERLRLQLKQERVNLQISGNLDGLVQHHHGAQSGGMMGRGRGVSNLPAWLVEKHKQQQVAASESVAPVNNNDIVAVEGKSLRTIILSNLTAPGDIDDDLAQDVKEECQEQCGPVIAINVRDACPPLEPVVQVYVEFGTSQDAKKGVAVFHGRKFGSRRITAEFMRE